MHLNPWYSVLKSCMTISNVKLINFYLPFSSLMYYLLYLIHHSFIFFFSWKDLFEPFIFYCDVQCSINCTIIGNLLFMKIYSQFISFVLCWKDFFEPLIFCWEVQCYTNCTIICDLQLIEFKQSFSSFSLCSNFWYSVGEVQHPANCTILSNLSQITFYSTLSAFSLYWKDTFEPLYFCCEVQCSISCIIMRLLLQFCIQFWSQYVNCHQ